MKIRAGKVTKEQDIAAETTFLSVPWEVVEGKEVVASGIQGFPLDATDVQVKDFLRVTLANFKDKMAGAEESRANQDALDNAEEVAEAISNVEITD